jgi:hypothetical protein
MQRENEEKKPDRHGDSSHNGEVDHRHDDASVFCLARSMASAKRAMMTA